MSIIPAHMLRSASQPFFSLYKGPSARYFHRVTAEFIHHDASGNLITRKVPCISGNPGESYVLIDPEIGSALRAASPLAPASAASAEERCKVTFFHDSRFFGFGASSYPRLYIPGQISRQTNSRTSPATLFLSGKMHEIVLDGTDDTNFAEKASNTAQHLGCVMDQLKDM
ncbi:hypothetical protein BDV18DRAFT_136379 [Aspergillus unguis]